MKKVLLVAFVLIFAFTGLAFAAKSSSRPASRPSAPAVKSAPTTQTTPSSGYKPSAPASSYNDKAPAAKPGVSQTTQPSTGSNWMRNVGMFAGGMMLGGLLSNMLGFGHSGMFADILGMLASILPILAIFMLGRFLWVRYKTKREKDTMTRS